MTALLIKSGKERGRKLLISDDTRILLGRGLDCQVRLPSTDVSKKHCILRASAGVLSVRDLGSRNGTLVNGVPIREKTHLKPGDTLSIGPFVFEVVPQPPSVAEGPRVEEESTTASENSILEWLAEEVDAPEAALGDTTIRREVVESDTAGGAVAAAPPLRSSLIVEEIAHVTVVRLNTKRLSAHNYQQVISELCALVEHQGHKRILIDFSGVHYVYSTALTSLAQFDSKVKEAEGELRLCNLHPVLREMLEATNLHTLFDIRADRRSALNAFW